MCGSDDDFTRDGAPPWERRLGSGFTLIELLVVISVLALLIGLIVPSLIGARESGRMAVCASNMRMIAGGILAYTTDHRGYLPWAGGVDRNAPEDWVWGGQHKSLTQNKAHWKNPPAQFGHHAEAGSIFPYVIGGEAIRNGSGKNGIDEGHTTIYNVYRCPSTGQLGKALRVNYSLNNYIDSAKFEADTVTTDDKGINLSVVRRHSEKILLANEDPRTMHNASIHPGGSAYGGGDGSAFDGGSLHVTHKGRINIAHMDGHVRTYPVQKVLDMQRSSIVVNGLSNRDRYFHPLK